MILKKSSKENRAVKAIIICGPTGSGKSDLGMRAARNYNGSIIGADSRQIYRGLDIGTAKPSPADRTEVPHYMIDIADITDDFSAAQYAQMAAGSIEHIAAHGRIPIVVGGAGLYLEALTTGLFDGPPKNKRLRGELEGRIETEGSLALHQELSKLDPETANFVSPGDPVRIVRALEIYMVTGRLPSELRRESDYAGSNAEFLWICLDYPRKELYQRIDKRVDAMMAGGLLDEIKRLLSDGLGVAIKKKKIVGYYELIDSIEKDVSLDAAVSLVKQHSRNYAKRQLTWFRNRTSPIMVNPLEDGFDRKVFGVIDDYLNRT